MMRWLLTILMAGVLISCSDGSDSAKIAVVEGVSEELAQHRKKTISNIHYHLKLDIPADHQKSIPANLTLTFDLSDTGQDVQLDLRHSNPAFHNILINGKATDILHIKEHVILPAETLIQGSNKVSMSFIAGDTSLNRQPEFLYTLFVPDRARTAFPVFDQPNLKATIQFTLTMPENWQAIANGPLQREEIHDGRKTAYFAKSDKMSSYLFSFVAGKFQKVKRTVDGRTMTMLHRENDAEKVARNIDAIFDLHASSLNWMEDYTEIPYPFKKFDFALIPSFQYGGMEHVGAIQYRARSLFLDKDPSPNELLSRASLIGHETAHMWFGNLVTMDWFNDVWTKEVYAGFMANKINNPDFPNINHDLNFTLRRYPAAYSVDRTEGANAIRQHLPNLNEAGTMYGAIIYNKAPIMMRQLETLLGEENFRQGLSQYLKNYANENATWPQLVDILDTYSEQDIKLWSQTWVETAGRPHFSLEEGQTLVQNDPAGEGRLWGQQFSVSDLETPETRNILTLTSQKTPLEKVGLKPFVNSDGMGYGLFPQDIPTAEQWQALSDLQKGALIVNLFEATISLELTPSPQEIISFLLENVISDGNDLISQRALGQMGGLYWQYLSDRDRAIFGPDMERRLSTLMMDESLSPARRKSYFRALSNVAETAEQLAWLENVWQTQTPPAGISLSENDYISLSAQLAIKLPQKADAIVATQAERIQNPDRARRYNFISASLSPDLATRDAFFESLKQESNRAIESWVLSALDYLHHPWRRAQSEKYLPDSLALMEEIQRTGDIFFPTGWIANSLGSYQSDSAVQTVRNFLSERPDYNKQLRLKILQGADPLFRANALVIP